METIKLGNTDMRIPKLGMGTWAIGGGPAWGDRDEQECVTTIQKAVKSGLNLLDTAPAYNFGNSEKIVGKALEGLERKDVCLITKCGIVWTRVRLALGERGAGSRLVACGHQGDGWVEWIQSAVPSVFARW